MTNLHSLSIYQIPGSARNNFAIPTSGLAPLLDSLPASCTALEIESIKLQEFSLDPDATVPTSPEDQTHLYPHLRRVLPQLAYLRLRLGTLCPAMCGRGYNQSPFSSSPTMPAVSFERVAPGYEPVKLPRLKECVINVARKWGHGVGNYVPANSLVCSSNYNQDEGDGAPQQPTQSCLTILVTHLTHLISTSQCAPVLEKLWVIDFQPHTREPGNANVYAAFVRRDILAGTSLACPHRNIGPTQTDTWHLRRPAPASPDPRKRSSRSSSDEQQQPHNDMMERHDWEDVVSWPWAVEQLAEGPAWEASACRGGVRLPSTHFRHEDCRLAAAELPMLSKDGAVATKKANCVLWANEKKVGQCLLWPMEKGLLAVHEDLDMRFPVGWYLPQGAWQLQRIEDA